MRVLVCGSRTRTPELTRAIHSALDQFHSVSTIKVIIEGGASGADAVAREWAGMNDVCCMTFNAHWNWSGRAAGPIRNSRMLKYGEPDLVLAFPTKGSKGTKNMISLATKAKVNLFVTEM